MDGKNPIRQSDKPRNRKENITMENSELLEYVPDELRTTEAIAIANELDGGMCTHCRSRTGTETINPKYSELYGDDIVEFICDKCYDELLLDI
jgi:hypothetical protein